MTNHLLPEIFSHAVDSEAGHADILLIPEDQQPERNAQSGQPYKYANTAGIYTDSPPAPPQDKDLRRPQHTDGEVPRVSNRWTPICRKLATVLDSGKSIKFRPSPNETTADMRAALEEFVGHVQDDGEYLTVTRYTADEYAEHYARRRKDSPGQKTFGWVTLPAGTEGDGTPVYIEKDGTIGKGPEGLKGKDIAEVDQDKEGTDKDGRTKPKEPEPVTRPHQRSHTDIQPDELDKLMREAGFLRMKRDTLTEGWEGYDDDRKQEIIEEAKRERVKKRALTARHLKNNRETLKQASKSLRKKAEDLSQEVYIAREALKELKALEKIKTNHPEWEEIDKAKQDKDWTKLSELIKEHYDDNPQAKKDAERVMPSWASTVYIDDAWSHLNNKIEETRKAIKRGHYDYDLREKHEQICKKAVEKGKQLNWDALSSYWWKEWLPEEEKKRHWQLETEQTANKTMTSDEMRAQSAAIAGALKGDFNRRFNSAMKKELARLEQPDPVLEKAEAKFREQTEQFERFNESLPGNTHDWTPKHWSDWDAWDRKLIKSRDQVLDAKRSEEERQKQRSANFLENFMASMNPKKGSQGMRRGQLLGIPSSQVDHDRTAEALEWLGRFVDRRVYEGLKVDIKNVSEDPKKKELDAQKYSKRSYCRRDTVYMADQAQTHTYIHEIGHAIEHANSDRYETLSRAFQASQLKKEKIRPLNQIEGYEHYDADEIGFKDDWLNAYSGKFYRSGTEILSMGLQHMFQDAAHFAKVSPEHFKYTMAVMTGQLTELSRGNE